MSRVKVTEIRGAFAFEGASYGPFQASEATPFTEVPAALASALNLPLHESEVVAQAEQADAGASAYVEQLLKANHDLKADLGKVTDEVIPLEHRVQHLQGEVARVTGERDESRNAAQILQAAVGEFAQAYGEGRSGDDLKPYIDRISRILPPLSVTLATTFQSLTDSIQANTAALKDMSFETTVVTYGGATPLPDTLPLRELLIENHFDTLEKLEVGLVAPEGQTESPVQQIDGIGKKTVQAYEKAVADWKAGH